MILCTVNTFSLTQIKLDQVMLFTLKVRCVDDDGHVWFDQRVHILVLTLLSGVNNVLRNISLYMVVKVCPY